MEVKTLLQSSSNIYKIDSKYPQKNKPTKKEEKDSKRTKSADFPFTDMPNEKSTYQSQAN